MFVTADRVKETSTTTGTGNMTLLGAASGYRAFSAIYANADTCYYCIASQTGTEWEVGIGTYLTAGPALFRAAIFASSNANALVNFTSGTKDIFTTVPAYINLQLDPNLAANFPVVSSDPPAPATGNLSFFSRTIAGRVMPKWVPPVGVDCTVQPSLFGTSIILYTPTSGTVVTGGFGTLWAKGASAGTVSHPTQALTAPAIFSQIKRTRHANAVTTTNQAMGIITADKSFWRGNAADLGGFFFFCRFAIGLWPANTCRLFVGMTESATEAITSETIPANSIGFHHLAADGANILKFVSKDATTVNNITVTGATIAAGQVFDAYIYVAPNGATVYFRLDSVNAGTILIDSSTGTNIPVNTSFLGPQAVMSNGTANITANTVAIDVNRIYVESDR